MIASPAYAEVWAAALPYMRARKNDVHIPLSYGYASRLVDAHPEADADVVLLAILLHDIGWAVVDQEAIYRDAFGPGMMESDVRIAHEKEGARLARRRARPRHPHRPGMLMRGSIRPRRRRAA